MENVEDGRPLGEMLMCLPARGADAVKNSCCSRAWSTGVSVHVWGMYFTLGGNGSYRKDILMILNAPSPADCLG